MSINRKFLLGTAITFCSLALTVPMTYAACPVASDCGCNQQKEITTPDNATCSKFNNK